MSEITQENYTESFASRPHILVVDDDRRIRDLLMRYLTENGFVVMAAPNASEAKSLMRAFTFDGLVLDVMMSEQTGLEFMGDLRQSSDIPVLLLTALGEPQDRIQGLEVGADDYLAKPFEPRELVLRLNAILKRAKLKLSDARSFYIGRWKFEPETERLKAPDAEQRLTSVEVSLIKALASKPGQVFTRDELAQMCGIDAGERTFDVQVTRLRRKIEVDTKNPRYLLTIRGKGYLLRTGEL